MTYQLGIDLGTTFTAAAIHRDDRATICSLGGRSASIPSVVLLRDDGTVLTGDAAVRRAVTEPERVAREFKRRLGDTTPIIVGGSPYSAEQLMARLLRSVIDEVEKREGSAPSQITISHPANWGPYKLDLFNQAIRLADLDPSAIQLITEPEAAAVSYASQERVDVGEVVAVYDLGGGTFDAAVLRRTESGFEIIGKPEGIERLGGIDFDAAVSAHVARSLDGALSELDPDDPTAVSAMARLRQDCVDAKEALSSDTDAIIPVLLPNVQTEVRITRREFEALIRPSLVDSIEAMHRAVRSAGLEMSEVSRVLLVGGSSRVPLIAQLVSSELGRPVAVDAHPKHAIALGAAFSAARNAGPEAIRSTIVEPEISSPDTGQVAAVVVPPVAPTPAPTPAPAPTPPVVETPAPAPAPTPAPAPAAAPPAASPPPRLTEPVPVVSTAAAASPPSDFSTPTGTDGSGGSRIPLLAGIGVVALLLLIGGFVLLSGGDDGGDEAGGSPEPTEAPAGDTTTTEPESTTTEEATTTVAPVEDSVLQGQVDTLLTEVDPGITAVVTSGVATLTGRAFDETTRDGAIEAAEGVEGMQSVVDEMEVQAEDERCTEAIQNNERFACITSAVVEGDRIVAQLFTSPGPQAFNVNGEYHMHIFGDNVAPETAGAAGDASVGGGAWQIWDDPEVFDALLTDVFVGGEVPERLCVRIATPSHTLDSLNTGTCWPIEVGTEG